MTQPTITLNHGVTIPQLGFGTFQVDQGDSQRVVEIALDAGYRHIDTAAGYGNEEGVGAALKASGLAREDVFITTKLANEDQGDREQTLKAFETSRKKLGVDVIDLYLIHWPMPDQWRADEIWAAFEKLLDDGAVRSIGVSNFLPHHLERLAKTAKVTPAVNQFEIHPTYQQREAQEASRRAGVAVDAYAPIGKGEDLSLPAVTQTAEAHGVSPAQVVLRWHLQQGRIAIPKSATEERIRSNFEVFGFELSDDEMARITELEKANRLFPDPDNFGK